MPILIMTSSEKNNDFHIEAMGNASNWFGHRKTAIRRMVQPLVPVIDTEGQYAVSAPLTLSLKPGGHGVIWKLAEDSGAIAWLSSQGIKAAIVRQVNNPLAGLDHALLTFIGHGIGHTKSFGFLSCPSRPGFAEGLNALFVKKASGQTEAAISNIEYTQFNTLKNLLPDLFKEGVCPANTNILYVNLSQINNALAKNPIPGMIVNAKTNIEGIKNGVAFKKNGGRLESCMQNLSEGMMSPLGPQKPTSVSSEALSTFLLLQDRDKLMSAIKKSYQPGQNPQETPIACLYDQNRAMRSLLTSSCQFTLPDEQTLDDFVKNGPSFMFSFHPAMGPLWDVIGQKLSKGTIFPKSHVDLEISEIDCKNLSINGSLKILATRITGIFSASFEKTFTNDVGRARLHNVTIVNKGPKALDFASILKGTVPQEECCEIVLEGLSELVASNITITGPFHLIVPNGKRATLTQDASGKILTTFDAINAPSWQYTVTWQKGCAPKLALLESA